MKTSLLLPLAAFSLFASLPAGRGSCRAASLSGHQKVTLGGEGGWDYLTLDPDPRRLYISRGTHVMVWMPTPRKSSATSPDTNGVHGIAFAPKLGRGFTTNGRDNSVTIVDLKTLKAIGTVKTGQSARLHHV